MGTDLAAYSAGYPERFVPAVMRGDLVEAEHLARYHWAAKLAAGRRVLDAGCGVAYGSAILAGAGGDVIGVDVAAAVLDTVRADVPAAVALEVADVRQLPFAGGTFDLVCCFEVIEHVEEPATVLDELVRVLATDGVLLVSSPNPDVYPHGNPHHHHELRLAELAGAMRERLPHVALRHQQAYLTTALLSTETFSDGEPVRSLEAVDLRKLPSGRSNGETYAVAAGSRQPLPDLAELAVITGDVDLARWNAFNAEQQAVIRQQTDELENLRSAVKELDATRRQLLAAEQDIATLPDRLEQIAFLQGEVARLDEELRVSTERQERAELMLGSVRQSSSWRLTAPLRRAVELSRPRRS